MLPANEGNVGSGKQINLEMLAEELVVKVIGYLSFDDLTTVLTTSKYFKRIADDSQVWKSVFFASFPIFSQDPFLSQFIADLDRRESLHWKFVARFKSRLPELVNVAPGKQQGTIGEQETMATALMNKVILGPDAHPCETDLLFLFAYQMMVEQVQNENTTEKETTSKKVELAEALLAHGQYHTKNNDLLSSHLLFLQCSTVCESVPLNRRKKINETWGVALLGLGHVTALVNGWETDDKRLNKIAWDKAEEIFLALPFYNIWRPFNLACLTSLRKQETCKAWLMECYTFYYTQNMEMKNSLLDDPDLQWIRSQKWFDEYMEQVNSTISDPPFVDPF